MYEVINYFTDLQDFNHPYQVGDRMPLSTLKTIASKSKVENYDLMSAAELKKCLINLLDL